MLTTLIALLGAPVALFWALPFLSELLCVLRLPFARRAARAADGRVRLLFLVPAHNERLLVEGCARSLVGMRRERADCEIVVVADNCSDDTAEIARACGATVLERFNTEQRGKPYAVEWAMAQYDLDAFDAVVIVDADTVVDPGFADAVARRAPLRDKFVQGYIGVLNPKDSWLTLLSRLLAAVRYEGQYLVKERVGLNCPVLGNGQVMGVNALRTVGWPNSHLTENWELYARCTVAGFPVEFAPDAFARGQETKSVGDSTTQRSRWQAGRMKVLGTHWRALLASSRVSVHQKIDALGELSSPGPITHAVVALLGAALFWLVPGPLARAVSITFLLAVLPIAFWTLVAWARQPDRGRIALALARLPVYAVWRLFVTGLSVVTGRRGAWIRSPRHVSSGE